MMLDKRKIRLGVFLCLALALVVVLAKTIPAEQNRCMGVPFIRESKLSDYIQADDFDLTQLTFNGENAAVDLYSGTVFVSQSPEKLGSSTQLEGQFAVKDYSYSLYFLKDAAMEDLSRSVRDNVPLTMIVAAGGYYQVVPVVITTLPVVNIEGSYSYTNEEERDVFSGKITMWAGLDPQLEQYSTQSSFLQWRIRGLTSATMDKNPWKLSLKDSTGANNDLDFLGMGADDDWLLNSMALDDTKIKEKFFIDAWNDNAKDKDYHYPMSIGEYVEVVINGEYMGLFLLQRRVDGKYLELSDQDALLKGTYYEAMSAEEAYELVTDNENPAEIYAAMTPVFEENGAGLYDLYNVLETSMFLQLASAPDNYSLKNIFHVLRKTETGYDYFLLPWDTDMSFGVTWKLGEGFCYEYEDSLTAIGCRIEADGEMLQNPDYVERAVEHWHTMRQTVFEEQALLARVDAIYADLALTGALTREKLRWPEYYQGADTVENMKYFISDRLLYLDEFYDSWFAEWALY